MKINKITTLILGLMFLALSINAQYSSDNNEAAIRIYTKRIESNPKDFDAYFERGKIYEQLNQRDKAIKDFTKAIEIDPLSIKAYWERSRIYNSPFAESDKLKANSLIRAAKNNTGAKRYSEDELNYCPVPRAIDYSTACTYITNRAVAPRQYIEKFIYQYEKQLWEMSCALPDKDSVEEAVPKIQRMWNKYKVDFRCDTKNVLKFALKYHRKNFIETIVENYNLDINFKDYDGKNVLDYVNDEINLWSKSGDPNSAATFREYRELLILLGAKPSW